MGGEIITESWFSALWRASRKNLSFESERTVGILAFEVATVMSKVVNLWQCLTDKQIVRLREDVVNSVGIQKLVSDNDDYLMALALAEIVKKCNYVAISVARLGKRCSDPVYRNLGKIFDDQVEIDLNSFGWQYRLKKMEKKVKKMERFVAFTAQLYQELEVLAELEQSLRRMQSSVDSNKMKLLEFQQKVMWQRQEVKNLREMSPWVRSYDYTVRLLLRSLFTIIRRIKYAFGVDQIEVLDEGRESECVGNDGLVRSHSISSIMRSSVYPSESDLSSFQAGPLGRSVSNLGPNGDKNRLLHKKLHARYRSFILRGKDLPVKTRGLTRVGAFNGCMGANDSSPVLHRCMPSNGSSLRSNEFLEKETDPTHVSCDVVFHPNASLFNFNHKLLNPPPSTLGGAALALHYANVIILIEKLAASPHLISHDAREDLYNMLPARVRTSLRSKLQVFTKTLSLSVCDTSLAAEWSLALARILEWLAPLAHNMIRWHSERNFERRRMVCGANVLLVQTLYFANQLKTEAAVTELLMGLNYLSRFGRELNEMAFLESACSRASGDYLLHKDNLIHSMITPHRRCPLNLAK